jgi:hypothetical protein
VSRVPRIVDVLLSLFPKFRRAPVVLHPRNDAPAPKGPVVATLFSGGVDSFYTLLKGLLPQTDPLLRPTHLFFMIGHEQPLGESSGADATRAIINDVARQTGTGVLWGETNLRAMFGLNYELYYHGAVLVASALALARGVNRLLVSSTYAYGQMVPWGSHPLLDELWSTEATEIIHDGAEALRVDKVEFLGEHPLALKHMRVCLKNQESPENCGRCTKCARTMMALELIGKLSEAAMFPRVSRKALARTLRDDSPVFLEELNRLALRMGDNKNLAFLRAVGRSQKRRRATRALIESTPLVADIMPALDQWRRRLRGTPRPRA